MAQIVFLAACSSSRTGTKWNLIVERLPAIEGGVRDQGAKVLSKSISLPFVCVCHAPNLGAVPSRDAVTRHLPFCSAFEPADAVSIVL
eukprot:4853307-Prymnesium_polylepis.1